MAERTVGWKISAPPPVRRIEAGLAQFNQRLLGGLLGQPGKVQDFDGGETF
jgi:hypothetical protein